MSMHCFKTASFTKKINLIVSACVFTALTLVAPFTIASVEAKVTVEISGGRFQPMPIAITPLAGDRGKEIYEVIKNDLEGSGLFRVVPPDAHIQRDATPDAQPRFEDWRAINVAALISAQVVPASGGQIGVNYRLWDIGSQEQMAGKQLVASSANVRRIGHKLADSVYTQLTGEDPYFDSRVVFVDETGPKNRKVKRLAVMDQDGANVRYLTSANEYILTPRFASKVQKVVYVTLNKTGSSLFLIDLQTGRREKVLEYSDKMVFAPALSPNGDKIAISIVTNGNTDLFLFDLRGGRLTRLTSGYAIDTSPSFSPDGSQITFNSDRGGSQQLYIMGANGSGIRRISFGSGRYATPQWSPKGDKIAFTKMGGGRFAIGVIDPSGGNERILSSSFLDEAPTWAPNGRVLMFFRQPPGGSGISRLFKVDALGILPENSVNTPRDASDPTWSPLLP